MAEIQNRTLICSVLFIDIVEYSRKPVVEQLHLKDRFNALLTEALRDVAVNDRVILDTGDGAACTFTGDPEDALSSRRACSRVTRTTPTPTCRSSPARVGINLGPVRLVKDINGQPNVIGDGINVAQRIMSFAQPGQVLVSRSYYDAVSRLSDESSNLFTHEGSRTDKHIREHEVYALCLTAAADQKRSHERRNAINRARNALAGRMVLDRAIQMVADIKNGLRRQPRLTAALAVAIVVGAAALAYGAYYDETMLRAPIAATAANVLPVQTDAQTATREQPVSEGAAAAQATEATPATERIMTASLSTELATVEPKSNTETATKPAQPEPAPGDRSRDRPVGHGLRRRQSARREPSSARAPPQGRQA